MPDEFIYDVFLSHNANDKPRVRRLAMRLRDAGLRVWFDEWSIAAGEIIALKVDEGLEQSRVLLLCLSPNALASNWVALERSTAIHRDPSNLGRRFIPLLLADCDLPDTLRRYKYLDYREESDAAFEELVTACQPEPAAASVADVAHAFGIDDKTGEPAATKSPGSVTLEHKFSGDKWAEAVAFSPDRKWIAAGYEGGAIKIWDLTTGKCRLTLTRHTAAISNILISPDGTTFLSCSTDATIKLWDAKSGEMLTTLSDPSRSVNCLARISDTTFLAGTFDGNVRRWDLKTKHYETFPKTLHSSGITGLAVHTGAELALSSASTVIAVLRLEDGAIIGTLRGHSESVRSVEFTHDGRRAISSSEDGTIKIWDLETNASLATLEGHHGTIRAARLSPDGTVLASTGWSDHTIRLWEWKSGECVEVIKLSEHPWRWTPDGLAWSPDGSRFVVGTMDGSVYVFRVAHLKAAPAVEPTRHYVNAKVVLLGEGTVGKTSLAHRLIEDKYVIRDRTHGMNVWQLDLPLPPDATREREALLWDLAGQEDYRLIHQLFLDETALALLLVNPQKDDPFAEAGDWLKALKAACSQPDAPRDVARLLIFSQIDVGGMKLGNAKIERFLEQYGFSDWLPTSAKTGDNCSDLANNGNPSRLKELIAASIPWDKLPWTSTPKLLVELKKAVVSMRDEQDIRLLRFAELTQRLKQALPDEVFEESDVRTAVTLLANHGLARPLKFGDLVLLQPELLNGYAGAIIRAGANKDEIGSVPENEIYSADFDFTGVDRLKHRPDEELLLRALVQTFLDRSLCIAEDLAGGRHLVFPSQYRREKDIPRAPDIFVSYTFSGEWQTVWTTLVVRLWYSQEFQHKELWRNAAEFSSPKGFTLGLRIDNKQGEGTATVSLYFDKEVPDELKAIFIEYVHRHLARFGYEVSRDRRYLCERCGTPVKDLDAVRKRLEAKKDFITCQGCDEPVVLIDFIEQRLNTDPVAQKILAMDRIATQVLDTQALEQILIGHMMATCGEANQIFRELTKFDYGIDGEVEFKDNDGRASGKKIYVQLKSGNSYLRTRKGDGSEIFDVKDDRHLEYWINQPVDVYLVIRQTNKVGKQTIRWMNVTRYLKERPDKKSRQIPFTGEKLDMEAVWKVRDQFFPKVQQRK
jgi:WD40 repeat protein